VLLSRHHKVFILEIKITSQSYQMLEQVIQQITSQQKYTNLTENITIHRR